MAQIKHNKYRNTGILFELLVRKITADTMSNQDSKAVTLINRSVICVLIIVIWSIPTVNNWEKILIKKLYLSDLGTKIDKQFFSLLFL
jgi:hypothetical protein